MSTGNKPQGRWYFGRRQLVSVSLRAAALILLGTLIGVVDDLQVRYHIVSSMGYEAQFIYQAAFMAVSAVVAFAVLRERSLGRLRSLGNLLMAVPVAVIADNVSIDAGTMKPYLMAIPRQGYAWRTEVFGGTPLLSQVAIWVNQQPIGYGIINGYLLAIGCVGLYLFARYNWSMRSNVKPLS
jgi:hypothetical protein